MSDTMSMQKLLNWHVAARTKCLFSWNKTKSVLFLLYRINFFFFYTKIYKYKNSFKSKIWISGLKRRSKVAPNRVDRWEFVYYRFAASIVLHRVALSDEWTHRRVHFSAPSFGRRTSISSAMLTWLAPRVSRARLASVDSRSIPFFRGVSTTRAARRH